MAADDRYRRPLPTHPVQPALAGRGRPGRDHPGGQLGPGAGTAAAAAVVRGAGADPVQPLRAAARAGCRYRAADRVLPHPGGRGGADLDGGLERRGGQSVRLAVPDPDRTGRAGPAGALDAGRGRRLPDRLCGQRHLRQAAAAWLLHGHGPAPVGRGGQLPAVGGGGAGLRHPAGDGTAPARTRTGPAARTLRAQRGHRGAGHPCRLGSA